MPAAALLRITLIPVIACSLVWAQTAAPQPESAKDQTAQEAPASKEQSEQTENQQEQREAVTIPDPSLSPLDGAWQLFDTGVKSDKSGERAVAVQALGLIRNNARATRLAESVLDDAKPEVRAAAAEALGKIGNPNSVPELKKLLDDKDSKVVLSAAQALIELKSDEGYEVYYEILTGERKTGTGLIASQEAMLKDPKKLMDLGFHEGLGFVPFGGISYEAFKTITKDDTTPLRAAAAKKLAQDPDAATTKALATAAGDKNWLVRASALEALAQRGDNSALKTVALYLFDDKPEVKYAAAGAVIHLSAASPNKKSRKVRK